MIPTPEKGKAMLTPDVVRRVCPHARDVYVEQLVASQAGAQITTSLRAAMYLAQIAVETLDLTRLEENLNYSAERASEVWHHRFPTPAAAAPYAHQPEKLANHVYCDRNGNGDEASGDGWKYRGRGIPMVTGFANYKPVGIALGLDLVAHPELLTIPEHAFRGGVFVWLTRNLNAYADKGDVRGARHAINGGLIGLIDCQKRYDATCELVGALSLNLIS